VKSTSSFESHLLQLTKLIRKLSLFCFWAPFDAWAAYTLHWLVYFHVGCNSADCCQGNVVTLFTTDCFHANEMNSSYFRRFCMRTKRETNITFGFGNKTASEN